MGGLKTCVLIGGGCLVLGIVVLLIGGGVFLFLSVIQKPKIDRLGGKTAVETLENFFESKTKHGRANVDKWGGGRTSDDKEIEFWVKGRKFRIDYYRKDGTKRVGIVSPDGKKAYFCYPDENLCKPAVASVDHYLDIFVKPKVGMEERGRDEEYDCDKFFYLVRETDNISGASNPWYTEDFVYCVRAGELVYVESRGDNPERGEKADLTTYRKDFTSLEVNKEIKDSVFSLPY